MALLSRLRFARFTSRNENRLWVVFVFDDDFDTVLLGWVRPPNGESEAVFLYFPEVEVDICRFRRGMQHPAVFCRLVSAEKRDHVFRAITDGHLE